MAFGRAATGATVAVPATGDQKWGEDFTADATASYNEIRVEQQGGTSAQKHKAAFYNSSTGTGLGTSAEVTVAANQAKGPVSYLFSPAVSLTQGTPYRLTVQSEPVAGPGSFYAVPFATSSMTVSGNEITDATRSISGDGFSADSSFGIWGPKTNGVTNGGLETDAAGWIASGAGTTIARTTAQSKFGSASLQVDTVATVDHGCLCNNTPAGLTITAGQQQSVSAWVRGNVGGESVQLATHEYDAANVFIQAQRGPTVTLTTGWQWLTFTFTAHASAHHGAVLVIQTTATVKRFFVDGAKFESGLPTPFHEATRNAGRIRFSSSRLDETQGGLAIRILPGWANTTDHASWSTVFRWADSDTNLIELLWQASNDSWILKRRSGGAGADVTIADTFAADEAITLVAAWTATQTKLSLNGAAFVTAANTSIPTLAATDVDVGSQAGSSLFLNGRVKWLTSFRDVLTDANASTINGWGNTDIGIAGITFGNPSFFWPADTSAYETPGAAPVNTVAPVISGQAVVGQTLSCTTGTWSNPGTYSYQWQSGTQSFANISGATSSTYVLTATEHGKLMRCVVTATNASGSASANSNTLGSVTTNPPQNSVSPSVGGGITVGDQVACTTGEWTGSPTFSYQWMRADNSTFTTAPTNIAGATASTYTLTSSEQGKWVRCTVTATNAGGSSAANSNVIGAIGSGISVPSNTAAPVASGTAAVGATVSTTNGTWSNSPTSYSYQWQRADNVGFTVGVVSISGATSASYVLTSSENGKFVRAQVTASNAAGASTPANSNVLGAVVLATPTNTVSPILTGSAVEGQTLTCSTGAWTAEPSSFAYQWQRSATQTSWANIAGATTNTRVLASADVANYIRCQVTASN